MVGDGVQAKTTHTSPMCGKLPGAEFVQRPAALSFSPPCLPARLERESARGSGMGRVSMMRRCRAVRHIHPA
eukprot:COSAG01_NODE_11193_length_1985_cov_2.538176_2_plen_72_part_00